MHDNIKQAAKRGEKIDDLRNKSGKLFISLINSNEKC
jgi:hypothetical protein